MLLRRLLVVLASAGAGFLLLCALGYASGHPDRTDGALVRLVWCAVPLAATCQLALAVGRADPPPARVEPDRRRAGPRCALLTAAATGCPACWAARWRCWRSCDCGRPRRASLGEAGRAPVRAPDGSPPPTSAPGTRCRWPPRSPCSPSCPYWPPR
ncbi:hypothetical protein NKH77_37495 [Streptomyces sp. M19]